MVRKVGHHINDKDRDLATGEMFECLEKSLRSMSTKRPPHRKIAEFLEASGYTVLEADEEPGFVVMTNGGFKEKATEAIKKNFRPVDFHPAKQKRAAQKLLARINLDSLAKAVKAADTGCLEIFFSGKTHKPAWPLRAIVSERNTWQRAVSDFLRCHLDRIAHGDPFRVQSSREVVQVLEEGKFTATTGFSIDIEDLFYSVPHKGLLAPVREHLEEYGEIKFKNEVGLTIENF